MKLDEMLNLDGLKQALEGVGSQISTAINIEKVRKEIPHLNRLDNYYFKRPVNQRGQTSYTHTGSGTQYFIDRWTVSKSTVNLTDEGLVITPNDDCWIAQKVEFYQDFIGKRITFSAVTKEYGITVLKIDFTGDRLVVDNDDDESPVWLSMQFFGTEDDYPKFHIRIRNNNQVTVIATKVEIGDHQTLCHQSSDGEYVIDDIPNYVLETLICYRYFYTPHSISQIILSGAGATAAITAELVVPMRANPDISVYVNWIRKCNDPYSHKQLDTAISGPNASTVLTSALIDVTNIIGFALGSITLYCINYSDMKISAEI